MGKERSRLIVDMIAPSSWRAAEFMLHGNDEVINHEADCSTTVRDPNVRDYGVSDPAWHLHPDVSPEIQEIPRGAGQRAEIRRCEVIVEIGKFSLYQTVATAFITSGWNVPSYPGRRDKNGNLQWLYINL